MDAPKEPKADAPSCDERRALASEARATKKWSSVLTHTKDASCWPDAREKRTRLRVEALLHQGRYMACAKEGASSTDATVAGWRRECYRRAAGDTPQGTSETP
jgi:hypothetical protein